MNLNQPNLYALGLISKTWARGEKLQRRGFRSATISLDLGSLRHLKYAKPDWHWANACPSPGAFSYSKGRMCWKRAEGPRTFKAILDRKISLATSVALLWGLSSDGSLMLMMPAIANGANLRRITCRHSSAPPFAPPAHLSPTTILSLVLH